MANYTFSPAGLTLRPSATKLMGATGSPTLMAVRQADVDCTVEAELEFTPAHDGDEAGLTIFISKDGHYAFSRTQQNGQGCIAVRKNNDAFPAVHIPCDEHRLLFRIEATKTHYILSWAGADNEYLPAATVPVLARVDAGKCFTGTLIGVFAQYEKNTDASAVLKSFVVGG